MNNDLMETPIDPVTAYGVTVSAIFANLETEVPEWGFYVPASTVSEIARQAGLQPDHPTTPETYRRKVADGTQWLTKEDDGRWLLRCGQDADDDE